MTEVKNDGEDTDDMYDEDEDDDDGCRIKMMRLMMMMSKIMVAG